ncbi:MAG: MBL fold metallo-hydrolase, partial [Burkholderiales bacterium]
MKLKFLGAAGEVTGSSLLVEADGVRFLVDCGMFQGGRDAGPKNRRAYAREIGPIDFVLLTHAHIDHCGLLPRFAWPRHGAG